MKKLYFPKNSPTHYWEYWDNFNGTFTVYWGEIGSKGEGEIISRKLLKSIKSQIAVLEKKAVSDGYAEIDDDDHKVLWIEYAVDGFGTEEDVEKRNALIEEMNVLLGWNGLGHCDGGSIGSDSMEVCCLVVDFPIAKRVISEKLCNTVFADYTRIFQGE